MDSISVIQPDRLNWTSTMQTFRIAAPTDAVRCFEIENSAYEGDEAATLKSIEKRIAKYPEGFLVLENGNNVVGFINSGLLGNILV